MSVGAISSLTSLGSSSTSSTSSADQSSALALDFSTYLKILTVQLQNQDPTNATDPNEFTQELIMMQQVQAQINSNEAIQGLTSATKANALATGVSYIGSYVRAETSSGDFSLQDGTAEIGYTLENAAAKVMIKVTDSDGSLVATLSGGTSSGDNYVTWNGTTSDGTAASDGAYTFTIIATNSNGDSVDVSNESALYKITGVESNSDGTLTLEAGYLSLLSTDVTGVYTSSTRPASTTATIS